MMAKMINEAQFSDSKEMIRKADYHGQDEEADEEIGDREAEETEIQEEKDEEEADAKEKNEELEEDEETDSTVEHVSLPTAPRWQDAKMQNEHLEVTVNPGGLVKIRLKKSRFSCQPPIIRKALTTIAGQEIFDELNRFENSLDWGDEYHFQKVKSALSML